MSPDVIVKIIILVILLVLSGFFSSAETALTTVNKIRIRTLADEGDKRAKTVLKVVSNNSKMLSAILVGNNVVNLSASSMATALSIRFFGSNSAGIATGILTFIILIFGELAPKTMATIHAERLSLRVGPIVWVLMIILTPVIFIVQSLANGFLRLIGIDPNEKKKGLTEGELRTIVDVGHESGIIEDEEHEMIDNMFDLGDMEASDIMVPRIDITFAQADSTYEELVELYRRDRNTRVPVYDETPDDVIGILNMKELLLCEDKDSFSLRDSLQKPYFTYEHKNVADLLVELKDASRNMAVVLDDYGVTSGLITLQDILEEIVGEIRDEYDGPDDESLLKLSDNEYLVEASMNLEDLNDALGLELASEDYDSIGGYMIGLLDHLPKLREDVTTPEGIYLQVRSKDRNRILKIYLRIPKRLPRKTD